MGGADIFATIHEQRKTKIYYAFKLNYSNRVQNWTSTGYHYYYRMHIFY